MPKIAWVLEEIDVVTWCEFIVGRCTTKKLQEKDGIVDIRKKCEDQFGFVILLGRMNSGSKV